MDHSKPTTAVTNEKGVTFDDALSMAKFGVCNIVLMAISGTILAAFLLETLGISYVIAVAGCDLQLSTQEKGSLSAVGFLGVIVSSHLWGFLADTRGRRKVIVPTLLLTFVMTVISSFMTNFWLITFFRFLAGIFISGSSATIYAYLGEFHNQQNGSRAIMGASFVFGLGCILLPGIAFGVINQEWELLISPLGIIYRPWRLFLVVCSIPGLIAGFILIWFPESPKFVLMQGDVTQAIETVQWIHRFNCGRKVEPLPIESILGETEAQQSKDRRAELSRTKGISALAKLVWNQTAPLFMGSFLKKTMIVCFLQFGTYLTSHGTYMFFPSILNQVMEARETGQDRFSICEVVYERGNFSTTELDADETCHQTLDVTIYEMSFILEVIYALGFAIIEMIINTVGRLPILVFVFAGCGIAGLLMTFVDIPMLAVWCYMILVMCGFAGSIVNAITVDLFPTNLRAMAVCISSMFGRLGGVAGANLFGLLLETRCELTFAIPGTLLIACGLLSFFIPNIYRRGTRPEMRHSVSSRV
ncbi:synaptic vesicle glycoprotein 2B-like [Ochlerotatus camptorhynchus]|uniref:synaptic vesicle glycoprotein 2B-like n=1 Tax=Ochlerotatus camptorhynchus TaxID=644619 RepID=UPI0031DB1A80